MMRRPPDAPAELIETHISVVALIGEKAFKLLKPISLGFLDHRRQEDRLLACRRETEVNRRFAPDVYLGVLDVLDQDGVVHDHLIAMRRMPASRRLSALLAGPDATDLVRGVARAIAGFHREAPVTPQIAEAGALPVVLGLWERGLDQLAASAPGVVLDNDIESARVLARSYLMGRRTLLEQRITDGWVRDGHGDLLSDDIFLLPDGPRILDCLAFDDRLRYGDVLADIAFLAMDLEAHGQPRLGERLIEEWSRELAEAHPKSLAHHYVAYRAHVRSKVAALRSEQGAPGAAARSRDLHALSLSHLERAEVRLVIVGGAPGTGKSTIAQGLAHATGWVVLRSDEIRKAVAGLSQTPADPGRFGMGLYAPEISDHVYRLMLDQAAERLAGGECVVLDASWSAERRREAARRVASERGARVLEIRCDLRPEIAAARILERRVAGEGPSDATPQIAARLAAITDPWPQARSLNTKAALSLVLCEALRLVGPA